jgi:hypothetical protein
MENDIKFENVEIMKTVTISKDGKIWGFTNYKNRNAIVVIPKVKKQTHAITPLTDNQARILKKLVKDVYIDQGYDEMTKRECDQLLKELNSNYFSNDWSFEIYDVIGTGGHKLPEGEREEVSRIMNTAQKIFADSVMRLQVRGKGLGGHGKKI